MDSHGCFPAANGIMKGVNSSVQSNLQLLCMANLFLSFPLMERIKDQTRLTLSAHNEKPTEIYARSCKAQCISCFLRLGLAEHFFFDWVFWSIVLYKQYRFEGGAALQDFQSFFHSACRRPANRAGSRTQPGMRGSWFEDFWFEDLKIWPENFRVLGFLIWGFLIWGFENLFRADAR